MITNTAWDLRGRNG